MIFQIFFSDFTDFGDFLTDFFFLTICLILGFSPLPSETPDSPQVPHCHFILKIGKKSEKNRISNADPQKLISDS